MNKSIRLVIADDHAIVRQGLKTLLADEPDIDVVGEAANGDEAAEMAEKLAADVLLLDLQMPVSGGMSAIEALHQQGSGVRIIVLSSFAEDRQVRQAIQAGVAGYLLKDVGRADLVQAIRNAHAGQPALHPEVQRRLMRQLSTPDAPDPVESLTARELDELRHIAAGRSNKEIAKALYLSEVTIKGYTSTLFGKLGVSDRTQAALFALRAGVSPAGQSTSD